MSNHFRPRARRARGRKWLLLRPAGWFFFCLSAAKPFMPKSLMQKLHLYIIFSGIYISGNIKNIFTQGRKTHFLPRAENAFSDHPVQKTFSGKCFSDQLGRNFFADQSAKPFLPAGNIISGNQLSTMSADFRKQYFRKSLPEYIENFPKFFGIFEK